MRSFIRKIENRLFLSNVFQNLALSIIKKRADAILGRRDLIEFFKKFPLLSFQLTDVNSEILLPDFLVGNR